MPININDQDYVQAERDYYEADSLEEKLTALKKMISHMPGHKGAEKLRAQLRTRYKKLESEITKKKKSGKTTQVGIKKQGHQVVILGKTNSGKSTLLSILTNAEPKISEIKFSTQEPTIGMTTIETVEMQLIENPAPESDYYDKGLTNSADAIILLINSLEELENLKPLLEKATTKQIILYNDKTHLSEKELRKLNAKMKSKKMNYLIMNFEKILNKKLIDKKIEIQELKELENKLFETFDKIRIYTKEPEKEKKSNKPVILNQDSTVKDVAEKILKGFSKKIKQTKIWGPSSKFSGQIVGLNHKLKDLDVVEFKTK